MNYPQSYNEYVKWKLGGNRLKYIENNRDFYPWVENNYHWLKEHNIINRMMLNSLGDVWIYIDSEDIRMIIFRTDRIYSAALSDFRELYE